MSAAAVSSFLAVRLHAPGPPSSLLPCMRVLLCIDHKTVTNYAACNVESRLLNCYWNSVATAQLVELTADVFEYFLQQKTSTAHPASRRPEHGASTPEASSDTVGVGEQDEGVSDRGMILIAS